MSNKITFAAVAALLAVSSVQGTAFAQSHTTQHQSAQPFSRFKTKVGSALGFSPPAQHQRMVSAPRGSSDGVAVYDGVGARIGIYRGPILGYAGTSCNILTRGGYVDICQFDANN